MSEEGKSAEDGFHALRVGEGELEADVGDDGEAVLRLTSELARDLSHHNGFIPKTQVESVLQRPGLFRKHTFEDSRFQIPDFLCPSFVDTLKDLALWAKVWFMARLVLDLGAGQVLAVLPVHLVPVLQLADPGAVGDHLALLALLRFAHVTLPLVE